MQSLPLQWTVGHAATADAVPAKSVPATVPGAVQLDWATAEGWPPHFVGDNPKQYEWMEDLYWTYSAPLSLKDRPTGSRLIFTCGGVDYAFDILVGGKVVHTQEGMQTPVELDLTDHAKDGDQLQVRVHPVPKSVKQPQDRSQANRFTKPAVSYGWDFHPRLVPLGIWQEAELKWVDPGSFVLRSMSLTHTVADSLDKAEVRLEAHRWRDSDTTVQWYLLDPQGNIVADRATKAQQIDLTVTLDAPKLWWPHDQGEPLRYESVVRRVDATGKTLEEHRRKIGLRRVKLVMNEGAWKEPVDFPMSRSTPPITLEINGRRIFAKGSNWVSPDIFPGTLTRDTYEPLLNLVKQNHMNIVRLWGGAPVQKEAFYDLCDELGIMAWQEFPLACNLYPDDPNYLTVLHREALSILHRLRQHACVVLWCGGNELFNNWSGLTDQSYPLRMLNSLCFLMDRHTPFLPTSPVMGMGHGHYAFRDPGHGREAWNYFQESRCTAYTEFGMPGVASEKTLRLFMPESELFPPKPQGQWLYHHGFGQWRPNSWLCLDTIEHYFGSVTSLEQMIELSQLMQAQGYKGLFEEARRQKPHCSMSLNWCLNEPWPTAANNSLISWPCEPKPALFAVGQSLRPVLASAKIRKFWWQSGEWFDPELWVLSDSPEEVAGLKVVASLVNGGKTVRLLEWDCPALPANTNQRGPRVQVQLPELVGDRFMLRLEVAGKPELGSEYVLCCRSKDEAVQGNATPAMNARVE